MPPKKAPVPKGSHKMPDGSIMKDSDMKGKKKKVKLKIRVTKMSSAELRKLISNHNKLTKIKIPKGTDYAGLEKLIADAGYQIDHEKKKLTSTAGYKSTEIPLPTPDTPAQKEEKKKLRDVKAVEKKRQKAIKVLTDKNAKKNIVKGAVALKGLVNKRQQNKKKPIPVKEKPIESILYGDAVKVMKSLGMKQNDIDDIGNDELEMLVEFLAKPLPDGLGKKPLKFKKSYSIDKIGKVLGSEGQELGALFDMASDGFGKDGEVEYYWTPLITSLPSDKKRIALIKKI